MASGSHLGAIMGDPIQTLLLCKICPWGPAQDILLGRHHMGVLQKPSFLEFPPLEGLLASLTRQVKAAILYRLPFATLDENNILLVCFNQCVKQLKHSVWKLYKSSANKQIRRRESY